jgi:hypothetical protein
MDEFERWKAAEPRWSEKQLEEEGNPVRYWIGMKEKYPNLSQFAIDIMTIPASSCECERLFSELGDLLEPKRRKIGAQLLAALQCIRAWIKAGFKRPSEQVSAALTDKEIDDIYNLYSWDQPSY